jgi:hypothetical protein
MRIISYIEKGVGLDRTIKAVLHCHLWTLVNDACVSPISMEIRLT